MLFLRRLRWIGSAAFWSLKHRSVDRGCWVAAFEHGAWPVRTEPAAPALTSKDF